MTLTGLNADSNDGNREHIDRRSFEQTGFDLTQLNLIRFDLNDAPQTEAMRLERAGHRARRSVVSTSDHIDGRYASESAARVRVTSDGSTSPSHPHAPVT